MRYSAIRLGMALVALFVHGAPSAAPVPTALTINASVGFDLLNSVGPQNAVQTGQLTHRSGGADATAGFTGNPAGGPLTGSITQTGDGIGVHFQVSGSSANGSSQAGYLFADYSFSLTNTSATETFTIAFSALYGRSGNTTLASGVDAFAESLFSVLDPSLSEVVFTDFFSDTVNIGNNKALASASNGFSISLAPGQSGTVTAFQKMRGGAFDQGSFSADLSAFLRLDDIRSDQVPPPGQIPTPVSLPLVLTALGALVLSRRRR